MRRVRSRGTAPEVSLRKALRERAVRFRACAENLPGKPDIVIGDRRLAIFIDGDFWHGGQWRRRRLSSLEDQFRETDSRDYWLRKIRRNMERDCRSAAALLEGGWSVLRLWESDVLRDLDGCVAKILRGRAARILSRIPEKSFFAWGGDWSALESHGWTARRGISRVTLAAGPLTEFPPRAISRRPPLLLMETTGRGADFDGLRRLGYVLEELSPGQGRRFVIGSRAPGGARSLPQAPECGRPGAIAWIAENYLNPLVNEMIHGRVLRRYTTVSRVRATG